MRINTIPVLLLMLLGFAQDQANKVDLGKEFKIKYGHEVAIKGEKLRITFRSVKGDSRCPTGVACVWAGNGEVAIEAVVKNKKQVVATLNTSLDPKEISYKGFKIKLIALSPYPKVNEAIKPKDYEATLIVSRDE